MNPFKLIKMNWITSYLAVGDTGDLENRENIRRNVQVVIDIRDAFYEEVEDETASWEIDPQKALEYVAIIGLQTGENRKTMIHCEAGISRSPFIAALYLVEEQGMSQRKAYKLVREKRPQTIEHREWFKTVNQYKESLVEPEAEDENVDEDSPVV
jgi:hypothetical protein